MATNIAHKTYTILQSCLDCSEVQCTDFRQIIDYKIFENETHKQGYKIKAWEDILIISKWNSFRSGQRAISFKHLYASRDILY